MSYICGDCHQEHKVPKPEEDEREKVSTGSAGLACVLALVRERNEILLQNRELLETLFDKETVITRQMNRAAVAERLIQATQKFIEDDIAEAEQIVHPSGECCAVAGLRRVLEFIRKPADKRIDVKPEKRPFSDGVAEHGPHDVG